MPTDAMPIFVVTDHPFVVPTSTGDTCAWWYENPNPRLCGQPLNDHKYEYGHCHFCHSGTKLKVIRKGWLRAERIKRGLSLRAAARAIGMSAAYLSDIELGRRDPSEDKKEEVCAYYDRFPILY